MVDGGVWANNPFGVAAIEAIGMIGWPGDRLTILSIETINEPGRLSKLRGKLPMATSVARLFMAGQAHSALGTAKIITGDVHQRKAIWRVDQTAPEGRYTLDNAARISEMRDLHLRKRASSYPSSRGTSSPPADEFVNPRRCGQVNRGDQGGRYQAEVDPCNAGTAVAASAVQWYTRACLAMIQANDSSSCASASNSSGVNTWTSSGCITPEQMSADRPSSCRLRQRGALDDEQVKVAALAGQADRIGTESAGREGPATFDDARNDACDVGVGQHQTIL